MQFLEKIPSWLKNRYLVITVLFLVWMLFIAEKNMLTSLGYNNRLNELKQSEQHLTKQIKETSKELNLLKTSSQTIEKYAREKYYMKKENEDIFVVKSGAEK